MPKEVTVYITGSTTVCGKTNVAALLASALLASSSRVEMVTDTRRDDFAKRLAAFQVGRGKQRPPLPPLVRIVEVPTYLLLSKELGKQCGWVVPSSNRPRPPRPRKAP
jgi:hypothetical protein